MSGSDIRKKLNIERKLNGIVDNKFESRKKAEKEPMSIAVKSVITLIVTIAVLGFLFIVLHYSEALSVRYESVINYFYLLQNWIMELPKKWLIVLSLFGVYFFKAYVPLLPLSAVCVIAGAFCPYWELSLLVNMAGLSMGFALKYLSGKKKGDGFVQNALKKNDNVKMALEIGGLGGYGMLFVFRLFPIFPINFVSRLYGTNKDIHFWFYMLVSLAGIFPRVFVYTYLGREIFDPFSSQFISLLIILAAATGISTFIINIVFYIKKNRNKSLSEESDG